MSNKEELETIHEIIKEVYPSTSMGDFGLKEQLCLEVAEHVKQQILTKASKWVYTYLYTNVGLRVDFVEKEVEKFKKAMEE